METALITGLVQLGGMAILAAMVFYFYRVDRNDTIAKLAEITKAEIDCRDKESDTRRELAGAMNALAIGLARIEALIESQAK